MMTQTIRAAVNGEVREFPEGTTIAQLLQTLERPSVGIAVALNDRVVRRFEFVSQVLADGDRIEIIKAVAGG
ncbi:MAG: sulfur carrier protein ThiS [Candidatus Eremiobacteraeota bacterium]|nr:sulfur carrier protein ThiS [Candidatus Eremiobacteraeota bacterium]